MSLHSVEDLFFITNILQWMNTILSIRSDSVLMSDLFAGVGIVRGACFRTCCFCSVWSELCWCLGCVSGWSLGPSGGGEKPVTGRVDWGWREMWNMALFGFHWRGHILLPSGVRVQLKCDGTRWRTGGEVKGKLANGVGSQQKGKPIPLQAWTGPEVPRFQDNRHM